MSSNQINSSAVYAMFEEIKSKLEKQPGPIASATPAVEIGNIAELQEAISKLNEVADTPREPQEHIHRHKIDLMSNKVLIVLAVVLTALVVSLWIVRNQQQTIRQLKSNDLKYRYIQMQGEASPEDILMLQEVFDYNRNTDSIRYIRQRVERYEQLVQQQAETEARAKLNEQRAKQLRLEIEAVKE